MTATVGVPPTILAGEDGWVEIREPVSYDEYSAIFELRRRVFGEEQGMVEAGVSDVDDSRSTHAFATFHRGMGHPPRPVATGRLTLGVGPNGAALITWVATLPGYRRRGIGEAVVRFLLAAADRGRRRGGRPLGPDAGDGLLPQARLHALRPALHRPRHRAPADGPDEDGD